MTTPYLNLLKRNPTYRLRLKVCDRCSEFYKGTKYSIVCPKCNMSNQMVAKRKKEVKRKMWS